MLWMFNVGVISRNEEQKAERTMREFKCVVKALRQDAETATQDKS